MKKIAIFLITIICMLPILTSCGEKNDSEIVLRVCNWEEYIDLGDWDEEELIELDNGHTILGERSLVEDFEEWYEETYGKSVTVEYSTFGTNEELYNQLTMGDEFDLVCPSEYMIMKMHREGMLEPYSESFFDKSDENNYYIKGVSPYILGKYESLDLEGDTLNEYAAGYMWGTLGLVYNPEYVDKEDASHWNLLLNKDYLRQVTIKDSVRDAYVAAMGIINYDEITSTDFVEADDYQEKLFEAFNRSDEETVNKAEEVLSKAKDNVYSFEVDSGKADISTGKIIANEQWSGDAVYTMDVAEEDDVYLNYSVPTEGANLWFDGWVMLKDCIQEDVDKKQAAEAFVNFVSRPDNVVRNMYYIGYTSVIAGSVDDDVFSYIKYVYEAEDEGVEYPLGYFFSGEEDDKNYVIYADEEQTERQLFAQYSPKEVVDRCVIMKCFSDEDNERVNHMWINVRCFDLFAGKDE